MPSQEKLQKEERNKRDLTRFRMNLLEKESNEFAELQGKNLANIDRKVIKDAGLTDPRANSNAAIFDLFVMAKHGVDFKDIPKFERGELEGHDKATYLAEFETFLKEHPVSTTNEKGEKVYHSESAKVWGELYRDADKKLSEYRFPDLDLGNPENWLQCKDDMMLLGKVGTDFLQVIQEQQMGNFRVPELNEGFVRGFGSEEAQSHFWANIVTLQNCKAFVQKMTQPISRTDVESGIVQYVEGRKFATQNQAAYRGKTLQEFRQNLPELHAENTIIVQPFASQKISKLNEADRKALEEYLEKGTQLPRHLEERIQGDLEGVKHSYPDIVNGDLGASVSGETPKAYLDSMMKTLSADGKGEKLLEPWQMTQEQQRAAELGFHRIYFPLYNLYAVSMNSVDQGKTAYDLIEVNGKPLREHCAAKYNEDPIFGEDRSWEELDEAERRQYMRIETMRATLDPADKVACHEYVVNAEGRLELDKDPATVGNVDPKLVSEREKRNQLPEFMQLSDEQLKGSYYNVVSMVDSIVTSLPREQANAEMARPPYSELDDRENGTIAARLYVEEGADDTETITDYAQISGSSQMHVLKVQRPEVLEQFRDLLRKNGARCDELIEERLNNKDERLLYGNALMHQVDLEEQRLNAAKQAKAYYVSDEGEAVRMENVRTTEALEKAREKQEELAERVRKLSEEVKNLPDAEAPLVFNPFSRGGNKKQKEMELTNAKEELEQANQALEKAGEDAQRALERKNVNETRLKEFDKLIGDCQKRYDTIKFQIEQDISPEGFEKIQNKTRDLMKAMGPNRIRRAADGYSQTYLLTKTPISYAAQSFGPAMDMGRDKSIMGKVALCSRNDFPVYDAVIVGDAAEQTLVDYWKEKEKGTVEPGKEDQYRRRLYDQVSQLDSYLDTMYKTLDDPEKNQQLWDAGITDPGNEPWHVHEKSARGTMTLKTAAEAYKAGLEQGWHIDDLGTLAAFNNIRRDARKNTLATGVTSQAKYVEFEKPVYKDEKHERWLDEMDALWEKLKETPIRNAEQRKELLDEIHESVRKGYARGYVHEGDAKGFHQTYATCRKRDLLIEQGREPAFVVTDGLTVSDKGKERLEEIEVFRKMDSAKLVNGMPERKQETEKALEEPDLITEEALNTAFIAKPEETGKSKHADWEMEKIFDDFNAKRSGVFLGRESAVHENLRLAAEKMRDLKAKVGYPMDADKLPEYLNALDEVAYRSSLYQKEKANASTPAGKQRLQGAKEFERMAKEEQIRVKNALNRELGTNHDLGQLRIMLAQAQAVKAEKKLGALIQSGKTLGDKEKTKVMNHAATILAATLSASTSRDGRDVFQSRGMTSVKKSILANKEFKSAMQDYLNKPGLTAKKLISELESGKAVRKMTKLRKEFYVDDQTLQKLEQTPAKTPPKKEAPKISGPGV